MLSRSRSRTVFFAALTAALVAMSVLTAPAGAQTSPGGEQPSGGGGVLQSINSAAQEVARVVNEAFADVAKTIANAWAEDAPAPLDPKNELNKLEKNLKRSPLPEYEKLQKDAEKTGRTSILPFGEKVLELWNEAIDALDGDEDAGNERPPQRPPVLNPYPDGCAGGGCGN